MKKLVSVILAVVVLGILVPCYAGDSAKSKVLSGGYVIADRPTMSEIGMRGWVVAELRGPDGKLKQRFTQRNIVTAQGDAFAAAAIYTAAYSTWGMKLGTATTAASKTGAGSYIAVADYVSGSAQALDDSTPKVGTDPNQVQFRRLWAAGEGTSATINRVAITDNTTDAGEADATHTYAISVFSGAINKGASDTLTVTWNVRYVGAWDIDLGIFMFSKPGLDIRINQEAILDRKAA